MLKYRDRVRRYHRKISEENSYLETADEYVFKQYFSARCDNDRSSLNCIRTISSAVLRG